LFAKSSADIRNTHTDTHTLKQNYMRAPKNTKNDIKNDNSRD